MGAVYFYHLTTSTLDATLPMLVSKASDAGWRVLVRSPDADLLDRLDSVLWGGPQDEFLPHGRAGGPHDADQPILLASAMESDGFNCLMCVGGDAATSQEVGMVDRTCIIFDGHDGEALSHARGQWKSLTDAGCIAQYWAQDDGRWVMKAESS